ncbi:MAG: response regulator [Spirochaetia bacterium]|nr:response regulator [Spirochaetia bacterium]
MINLLLKYWLILTLFTGLSQFTYAANSGLKILEINDKIEKYDISPYLSFYEDKTNQIAIHEFVNNFEKYNFIQNKKSNPNFGITESSIWGYFLLKKTSAANKHYILLIDYPVLANVNLYLVCDNKIIEKKNGNLRSANEKDILSRNIVFNLDTSCENTIRIFFKISTYSAAILPVYIFSKDHYSKIARKENLYYGTYFGILLIMIFYNLFIFFSLREKVYLYYVLFVVFLFIFQLFTTGYQNEIFDNPNPNWIFSIALPANNLVLLFAILFARTLFSVSKVSKILLNLSNLYIFIGVFNIMLIIISPRLSNLITYYMVFLSFFLGFSFGISGYKRINIKITAYYFIAGWLSLLICASGYILKNMGILPSNMITKNMLFLGSILEVSLFSLALANRINELKDEKLKAQKEAIQNRELAITNLKKADRIKDEFLANTSHEFRTPLHGIMGLCEIILTSKSKKLGVKDKKNIELIHQSTKRLYHLVNDLLDHSQIKEKEIKLNLKPVNLYSLVNLIISLLSPIANQNNIKMKNNVSQNFPTVNADIDRLEQILLNLTGNSIKHTQKGSISISAINENNLARILVTDTGSGIPEEKKANLFKVYENIGPKKSEKKDDFMKGSGLGLFIVKNLVELHGGKIWLNDEHKKGTEFIFTLPLAKVETSSVIVKEKSFEMAGNDLLTSNEEFSFKSKNAVLSATKNENSNKNILLVDDNLVNIELAMSCLQQHGYEVFQAENGKSALSAIKGKKSFDILIIDLMMPDMNGFEVCKEVRKKHPAHELPILILTARKTQVDFSQSINAGANDFLTKPYESSELILRVNNLLIQSENEKEKISMFQREREKIFSDLHNHMGGNLLDIKIMLSSLFNKNTKNNKKIKEIIEKSNTVLNVLKERIQFHEIVHQLDKDFFGSLKIILLKRYLSMQRILDFHFDTKLNKNMNLYFKKEILYNLFSMFLEICNNDIKYGYDDSNWIFRREKNIIIFAFFSGTNFEIFNNKKGRGSSEIIATVSKLNGKIKQNLENNKFELQIKLPVSKYGKKSQNDD